MSNEMSNEMLNRIKNRSQRPIVQRDSSLDSNPSQEPSSNQETAADGHSPAKELEAKEPISSTDETEYLKKKLESLPKIAPRRNIRLEESLNQRIQQFCQEQNISIETFLEACFLACESDSELKSIVTEEAKRRIEQRKEAGKIRRLYSQLEKWGTV